MGHGMLNAAHVQVNWHVLVEFLEAEGLRAVVDVKVAKEVPGGIDECVHCVVVTDCGSITFGAFCQITRCLIV